MIKNFTDADVTDQSGKTFFITGANTGLGYETARVLAREGGRVLMGCRNEKKAKTAMQKIRDETPKAKLEFIPIDLADLASVEDAANIVQTEKRLDALINNAGIMYPPLDYTDDGFEQQFGVNHLGTFALTGHLLPKLSATAEKNGEARVITTSSIAHTMNAQIYFDDLDAQENYSAFKRYNQSKLANILFAFELHRRLRAKGSNIASIAVHPGVASTELSRFMPKIAQTIIPVFSGFLNNPLEGAWPTLLAATHENAKSGKYYGPDGLGGWTGKAEETKPAAVANDPALAKKLWDVSVEMTGVNPKI